MTGIRAIDGDAFLKVQTADVRQGQSGIRQFGTTARGCARNSCADARISGCQPDA
jgi:hypothetical protein